MAFTQSKKTFCVLEFIKTESWTLVQSTFRTKFRKEAPERKSILRWQGKFIKEVFVLSYETSHNMVWQELNYRVNVCHVTNSAHTEHL